jgi:DivIVA domain-containing protein
VNLTHFEAGEVLSRPVDAPYRRLDTSAMRGSPMSDYNVSFRSVLRGYDTTQVDHHMNELAKAAASAWQEATERSRQINELKAANGKLKNEAEGHAERARVLEKAQMEAAAPTYTGLGERIGSVLTLVDHEVNELRMRAQADAANKRALAEEDALATCQDADTYARQARSSAEDEVSQILEEARQQADSLVEDARQEAESLRDDARQEAESIRDDADRQAMARQDADRQAMAQREEAEALYEQARAKSAAAAIDFETTLAARREASALEFAAQVTAAEQQLAAVRLRSERARNDSERAQQEAASKIAQQLEQATARAQMLVAEAKTKAERIRDNSERELTAATQRRDSINAQLSNVRHDLAALGATRINPMSLEEPDQNEVAAEVQLETVATVQAAVQPAD